MFSAAPFAGVCRGVAGVRLAVAFRELKPLRAMDEVGHSAGVRFTAEALPPNDVRACGHIGRPAQDAKLRFHEPCWIQAATRSGEIS